MPFYFQLAETLEHEIVSGRWPMGARIPSEPAMARHFALSRSTVRQALARLEQEGLVIRRKGEGTFVGAGSPRSWLLQTSEGLFQEELMRSGRRVVSSILDIGRSTLPSWACDALELPADSPGVAIERLRRVDDLVALYVVNYLPDRVADTVLEMAQDPNGSLYERLAEHEGLRVAGARRTVEAVNAGERLGPMLEVASGSALAFIQSVSWDRDLVPFDCYRAWVRTDRMRLDLSIASTVGPAPAATPPVRAQTPFVPPARSDRTVRRPPEAAR